MVGMFFKAIQQVPFPRFVLGLCLATCKHMKDSSLAMKVDVYLPSGDGCCIAVSLTATIGELKAAAEQHFQRRLKLIAKGRQLDLTATRTEAGVARWGDGDCGCAAWQASCHLQGVRLEWGRGRGCDLGWSRTRRRCKSS